MKKRSFQKNYTKSCLLYQENLKREISWSQVVVLSEIPILSQIMTLYILKMQTYYGLRTKADLMRILFMSFSFRLRLGIISVAYHMSEP